MEDLLRPLETVKKSSQDQPQKYTSNDLFAAETRRVRGAVSSPEDVLQILKTQHDFNEGVQVIDYLQESATSNEGFNIKSPGPEAAQILNVLVSKTIPDYLRSFTDASVSKFTRKKKTHVASAPFIGLIKCLSSVAGIGALIAQIKTSLRQQPDVPDGLAQNSPILKDLLSVLESVFETPNFVFSIRSDIVTFVENQARRQVVWKEFISLVAAGKVLSVASEAYAASRDNFPGDEEMWLANGTSYATWLGQQISTTILKIDDSDQRAWKDLCDLFQRSLSIGYSDQIIEEVYSGLVLIDSEHWNQLRLFLGHLHAHSQVVFFETAIRILSKRHFPLGESLHSNKTPTMVSGIAYFLKSLVTDNEILEEHLAQWLTRSIGGGAGFGVGIRRSVIAALARSPEKLQHVLEQSIQSFGDKLYVKHSPVLQQEVNVQILLLTAGYVHRTFPSFVSAISKSGIYLNAISNRLSASSTRSRFLGMAVGIAISRLVDPPEKAMKFDLDGISGGDSQWYLSLTKVEDHIGSMKDVKLLQSKHNESEKGTQSKLNVKPLKKTAPPKSKGRTSKIISIEEISDDENESDDMMGYEKPDSDAEDLEDDPTLINREKPSAPVYIRDLLAGLRDFENHDRYQLAINIAPSLIRRKAGFGTEVTENIEDLALALVSLQDKYDFDNFEEIQLQSMIAVLVAKPEQMGFWFARMLFEGDFSVAQRTALITAIGLGARELAGFREEDSKVMGLPALPDSSFPTKALPERLHAIYSSDGASPMGRLTKQLSQRAIEPLALNAADQLSGPDALKVRTFSSRMNVEKKRKQREAEFSKARNKNMTKILTGSFISPLTGRFGLALRSWRSDYNPFLTPSLLTAFVQTLTLLLHTLGPSPVSNHDITHECLPMLLSIRSLPNATEHTVLEALLSAFLAIIDLNTGTSTSEEMLVSDYAREVTELREWAGGVFEKTPQSEERVRMLAAGIMVKLGEVAERWERRLLGAASGF